MVDEETRICDYEVKIKNQWHLWKQKTIQDKTKQAKLNIKVLLTVFFDCYSVIIIGHEYIQLLRNSTLLLEIMRLLRELYEKNALYYRKLGNDYCITIMHQLIG